MNHHYANLKKCEELFSKSGDTLSRRLIAATKSNPNICAKLVNKWSLELTFALSNCLRSFTTLNQCQQDNIMLSNDLFTTLLQGIKTSKVLEVFLNDFIQLNNYNRSPGTQLSTFYLRDDDVVDNNIIIDNGVISIRELAHEIRSLFRTHFTLLLDYMK